MNKNKKIYVEQLLEHLQSVIQEIHTQISPHTIQELIDKWEPMLKYANIPEENYEACVSELEDIEINFYSTLLRAKLFKKITDIYKTVPFEQKK